MIELQKKLPDHEKKQKERMTAYTQAFKKQEQERKEKEEKTNE